MDERQKEGSKERWEGKGRRGEERRGGEEGAERGGEGEGCAKMCTRMSICNFKASSVAASLQKTNLRKQPSEEILLYSFSLFYFGVIKIHAFVRAAEC